MAFLTTLLGRLAPLAALVALLYATPPTTLLERYPKTSLLFAHPYFKPILRTLIALGLLRALNKALTTLAQNNWHLTAPATWDWPNELAVVTGGSSGIGLSIVRGLVVKGVRVAIVDLQPPPADLPSDQVVYFRCDVGNEKDVSQTAAKIREKFNNANPSILVNNAGIARRGGILDVDEATVRAVIDVNIVSMFWTTKHFVPAMVAANKGHVVTVASIASFIALARFATYSSTKAGAHAFHEALAAELKTVYEAPGVVTTVVHPNFVRTPLVKDWERSIERGAGLLTVEDVSGPVLRQIFAGKGAQIVVPSRLTLVSSLRGWPSWVQEFLRDRIAKGGADV